MAKLDNGQTITSRHPMWYVHERYIDRLSIDKKKHLETASYNGLVYCATVPNSTLITRRNGSVLISGNCWANGPVSAINCLQLKDGGEFINFSPASVAAPIKNFRNNGGWGLEAIEYIVKYGIVPTKYWPANAIDRKYYTQANLEIAKQYKILEWDELDSRNIDQVMTLLLLRRPVEVEFSWWSHAVCAIDPVYLGSNQYGIRI